MLALNILTLFFLLLQECLCTPELVTILDDNGNRQIVPPATCTTVTGRTCIFPFRFNGVLYNACTFDWNAPEDTEPWCSTLTDPNDEHQFGQGEWGFCSSACPVDGDTTYAPPPPPPPTSGQCGTSQISHTFFS